VSSGRRKLVADGGEDEELRAIIERFCREEARHEQFLLDEYAKRRDLFARDAP
jgi:rubrerythrin